MKTSDGKATRTPVHDAMDPADHAWLRMDTPENLVVINFALSFQRRLPLEAAAAMLDDAFCAHHQFTHLIDRGPARARWQPDPLFAMARHLDEAVLPAGSTADDLKTWMARIASQPLPEDRPLWQATLVHGVGEGSALVLRVHHCLIDGISLMPLITRVTQVADGGPPLPTAHPSPRPFLSAKLLARRAPRALSDALGLLLMRNDTRTRLKGTPQLTKNVAWSETLSLQEVRDLAHRHGATVNDVMLTVITEALRRHLLERGAAPTGGVRAIVPMSLRPLGEEYLLGNRFGLIGQVLPVHLADPMDQLRFVRDGMHRIKSGLQGQITYALLRVAGLLPASWQAPLLGLFTRRGTVIVTNIIGPAERRSVAGVPMDGMFVFVPQGMMIGVGVSILSYGGEVRIAILADQALMPDVAGAAAAVPSCFDQLRRAGALAPTVEGAALPADVAVSRVSLS